MAKERLTTEEMKNKMLLRTDREGRNACVNAAFGGKMEAMWKFGIWLKRD